MAEKINDKFINALNNWIKANWEGSDRKLADYLGVSPQHISNIKTKKRGCGEETRIKICNKIGIDYRTIINVNPETTDIKKNQTPIKEINERMRDIKVPSHFEDTFVVQVNSQSDKDILNGNADNYRGIPLYESGRLSAGNNGVEFDPYEIPSSMVLVYKPELQGRSMHKLAAVKVGGDSMAPSIPQGAIVVVDLSDKKKEFGRVFAINTPDSGIDTVSIKRVRLWEKGKGFVIISDNESYPPDISFLDWNRLCVGRVVWMWRDIRNI